MAGLEKKPRNYQTKMLKPDGCVYTISNGYSNRLCNAKAVPRDPNGPGFRFCDTHWNLVEGLLYKQYLRHIHHRSEKDEVS